MFLPVFFLILTLISSPVGAVNPEQTVVTVNSRHGQGTGFFINSRGFIITNHHVTGERSRIEIKTFDGQTFSGFLHYRDPARDLALYRIDKINTPALPLIKDIPEEKTILHTIGSPLGLEQVNNQGSFMGITSRDGYDFIQVDMKSFPGISGSPLFTKEGHIIGVNTMTRGNTTLAIPSSDLIDFLKIRGIEFSTISLNKLTEAIDPPPREPIAERLGAHLLLWNIILLALHLGLGIYNYRLHKLKKLRGFVDLEEEEDEDQQDLFS